MNKGMAWLSALCLMVFLASPVQAGTPRPGGEPQANGGQVKVIPIPLPEPEPDVRQGQGEDEVKALPEPLPLPDPTINKRAGGNVKALPEPLPLPDPAQPQ